uniref:Uncharacterized protein n=1 Tax=viral metagenome TaxID=1070528 RepID=A0A6H1ZDJ7_9ZZZZ
MFTRPELIDICKELNIEEYETLRTEELKKRIRERADELFKKRAKVSIKGMSKSLMRFLTKEFDYVIKNKNKKIIKEIPNEN